MPPARKLPAVIAALALLGFASALFFPALFQGKILAPLDITTRLLAPWNETANRAKPYNQSPSDAVSQYLPYRFFAEKSLREDGYIGWNPYEMGGYSLAGNTMALPGSWPMQLHGFLPFKDAWNLGIFAEYLIAGTGMLAFLRSRRLPWLPCLIGAAAYMFNSQFIVWVYHRWALGSFCWMPWACWALGSGFKVKPLPARIWLLPGFLTLALLGGSLQHAAFVVLSCGCLAAGDFDFRRPLANTTALVGWTLAFVIAIGLAAFTLVPQLQGYLTNIEIGHVRGSLGYEDGISQPFFHLLLIPARIWPWLAGDPQSIDGWRLLKSGFMELNYLGTIPMLLGFAGLFLGRMPKAAKWLIVLGLVIPLTPLVGPLYHRVELLFIFGCAWMSAEMLGQLSSMEHAPRASRWLAGAVAAVGLGLLVCTCLPSGIRTRLENQVVAKVVAKSGQSQFGADKEWIASRGLEWTRRFSLGHPRTAWVYGLLVMGSAGLLLSSRRENQGRPVGQMLILCATSLELATVFQIWTTFSDPADLHPRNAAIETVRSLVGSHRVLQSAPHAGFADMFATPNLLAAQSIASVDGYESIQYRSPLVTLKDSSAKIRLNLAGVALAVQPPDKKQPETETWPQVGSSGNYTFLQNPTVPPMVAAGTSSLPDTVESIDTALATATGIEPTLHTMNRWAFRIPQGCRWIRIAQNWHEGWRWRVPGQAWQPFQKAPDACCWITSPPADAGDLEVRFSPRPPYLIWVALVAALLWCGLALPSILGRFRSPLQA